MRAFILVILMAGMQPALAQDFVDEPSVFPAHKKLFIVSDVEGQLDGFVSLLGSSSVIDQQNRWSYGKGRLVICGDLVDRGPQSLEMLEFLQLLEKQALVDGGYVHVVLGNHDIMNMGGDYRYVHPKHLGADGKPTAEYLAWFGRESVTGRWLRSKNVMIRIGDVLYTHGGISAGIVAGGLSIAEINALCRKYYDSPRSALPDSVKPYFGADGPFWFRGYFEKMPMTEELVDQSLKHFGVKRIVVGHTIMPGNIGAYYNGKVIAVDVDRHKGDHQALVYEKGKWSKVDDKGNKTLLLAAIKHSQRRGR